MKKFYALTACAALLLASCGNRDTQNNANVNWYTGPLMFKGHEDITRFATLIANAKIGWELFPQIKIGDSGMGASNPVVLGNYHTDFSDGRISNYYAERGYDVNNKNNQALHFLRSFVNGKPVSVTQACNESKQKILQVTNLALASWHVKDASSFFFWAGHVSHTIQDSFAPAHVQRGGADLRTISGICTYGTKVSGICYHSTIDKEDNIWNSNYTPTSATGRRPLEGMTKEAQGAVLATAGYFYMLNRAILTKTYNATTLLNEYFTSKEAFNGGYFNCDR